MRRQFPVQRAKLVTADDTGGTRQRRESRAVREGGTHAATPHPQPPGPPTHTEDYKRRCFRRLRGSRVHTSVSCRQELYLLQNSQLRRSMMVSCACKFSGNRQQGCPLLLLLLGDVEEVFKLKSSLHHDGGWCAEWHELFNERCLQRRLQAVAHCRNLTLR